MPAPEQDNPQLEIMRELVELSSERSYMNAERTLAVWTRTALSLMIFGIAVDRFGLLLRHLPWRGATGDPLLPHPLSTLGGVLMVALGVVIVVATAIRYLAYAIAWRRTHRQPAFHGPYLAFTFAVMVAMFGIAILWALLAFTD